MGHRASGTVGNCVNSTQNGMPEDAWGRLGTLGDAWGRPVAHFVRYLRSSRHFPMPCGPFCALFTQFLTVPDALWPILCAIYAGSRQFPTLCGPFWALFTQFPTVPDALWAILCAIYAVPDSSRCPVAHFVRYLRSSRQFPTHGGPFCALFTQLPTVPDAMWPILWQ